MIKVTENEITLALSGKITSIQPMDKLQSIYCLLVGSDVLANDSHCYLLVFHDEMWLLPDTVQGCQDMKQLRQNADNANIIYATIDYLPYRWRARWLFLPGTSARLKILPVEQLSMLLERITLVNSDEAETLFFI